MRSWGRKNVASFVVVLAGWVTWTLTLAVALGDTPAAAWIWTLSQAAVVVLAFYLSYSKRCPRCGYRLGYQQRLGIPRRCERCSVGLR